MSNYLLGSKQGVQTVYRSLPIKGRREREEVVAERFAEARPNGVVPFESLLHERKIP